MMVLRKRSWAYLSQLIIKDDLLEHHLTNNSALSFTSKILVHFAYAAVACVFQDLIISAKVIASLSSCVCVRE